MPHLFDAENWNQQVLSLSLSAVCDTSVFDRLGEAARKCVNRFDLRRGDKQKQFTAVDRKRFAFSSGKSLFSAEGRGETLRLD